MIRLGGGYVVFADADDAVDLDAYEILVRALNDNNADVAACDLQNEYKEFRVRQKNEKFRTISLYDGSDELVKAFFYQIGGWGCNKIYRRNIIGNIRFREDIVQAEDTLFSWQVIKECKRACFVDLPLYHYRFMLSSSSRGAVHEKLITSITVWNAIKHDLDEMNIDDLIIQKWASNYIVWNLKICESMIFLKRPDQRSYIFVKNNIARYKKYIPTMSRRYQILARSALKSWKIYKFWSTLTYSMKKVYVAVQNRLNLEKWNE